MFLTCSLHVPYMFLTCSLWKRRFFEGAAKHPHAEQDHHRFLASSGSLSEYIFLASNIHFVSRFYTILLKFEGQG